MNNYECHYIRTRYGLIPRLVVLGGFIGLLITILQK